MNTDGPDVPPRQRPGWVWGISILYVVTSVYALLNWLLIYLGVSPLPGEQQALILNQSHGSMLFRLAVEALSLAAAVFLWLLRRRAFDLFVASFVLGVAWTVWQFASSGPLTKLASQGALAAAIIFFSIVGGWAISGAICIYVWRLRQRGVLQ
jgi:hypothetical protein